MSNCIRISLLTLSLLSLASASQAGTIVLDATDSGWHSEDGNHTASNENYSAGWSNDEFRNFFVFDLSGLPLGKTVTSVTLRAYNPDDCEPDCSYEGGYDSPDGNETYELRAVLATSAVVTAPTIANTTVYDDLGDGDVYGSVVTSAADLGEFIEVTLNAAGISAVQSAFGFTDIVLGGKVTTLSSILGVDEFIWGHTDPPSGNTGSIYDRQLVIQFTPEPSTGLLVAFGLVGVAARRRHLS